MKNMTVFLTAAALAVLNASGYAASASDVFDEKPSGSFSPSWSRKNIGSHSGLEYRNGDEGLTVTGFKVKPGPDRKAFTAVLERGTGPVAGDFTAVMDIQWALPAGVFMGEVLMQVFSDRGTLIAEAGLIDNWISGSPRSAAWVGSPRKGGMFWLPDRADGPFMIVRSGAQCRIYLGHWKLADDPASMEPVGKIRLVISHKTAYDRAGTQLSRFGEITFRRLALKKGVMKPPPPRFAPVKRSPRFQIGTPIVSYWAGPPMSDKFAAELAAGGWNLAWGLTYHDLDIMHKHNLRGLVWMTLSMTANSRRVRWFLDSIRNHPAFYGIHCGDEPGGAKMLGCQRGVQFMENYDPGILHFNNMFPINASNKQLGHTGTAVEAYRKHIAEYFERLKPQILCYDKYNLWKTGDEGSYFINQAIIRKAGLKYGVKTMNIVQGCSYSPVLRAPNGNEYRYLAYTSLAYGSQGLANYVYSCKGHWGSVRDPETGKTTELYEACKSVNREFAAIAAELQSLTSLAAWHSGEIPFGTDPWPENSAFRLRPKPENISQGLTDAKVHYAQGRNFFNVRPPVKGFLMGVFGRNLRASHLLLVNLDYRKNAVTVLESPSALERFDQTSGVWSDAGGCSARLDIPPGSGILLRLKNHAEHSLYSDGSDKAVVKVRENTVGENRSNADEFVDNFSNLASWSQDYRKDCAGIKYRYVPGSGLLIEGLKNASGPYAAAYLDRGIPVFVEGDFQCSMEVGIPAGTKPGQNEIVISLQVPNGEDLIFLRIADGKVFSGSPGFRGSQISSSPIKMLNAIQSRGVIKIVRKGDVFTVLMNDVPFYRGTGDTTPAGNIRVALHGRNCQLELRNIVIRKLKQ